MYGASVGAPGSYIPVAVPVATSVGGHAMTAHQSMGPSAGARQPAGTASVGLSSPPPQWLRSPTPPPNHLSEVHSIADVPGGYEQYHRRGSSVSAASYPGSVPEPPAPGADEMLSRIRREVRDYDSFAALMAQQLQQVLVVAPVEVPDTSRAQSSRSTGAPNGISTELPAPLSAHEYIAASIAQPLSALPGQKGYSVTLPFPPTAPSVWSSRPSADAGAAASVAVSEPPVSLSPAHEKVRRELQALQALREERLQRLQQLLSSPAAPPAEAPSRIAVTKTAPRVAAAVVSPRPTSDHDDGSDGEGVEIESVDHIEAEAEAEPDVEPEAEPSPRLPVVPAPVASAPPTNKSSVKAPAPVPLPARTTAGAVAAAPPPPTSRHTSATPATGQTGISGMLSNRGIVRELDLSNFDFNTAAGRKGK